MRVSDDELHAMAAACYAASQWRWPELHVAACTVSDDDLHNMASACYEASRWQWPPLHALVDNAAMRSDSYTIIRDSPPATPVVKRRRILTLAD